MENLKYDMVILLRWLKENLTKANQKMLQFMILGKTPRQPIMLNIYQIKVREPQKVVLLGLTIGNRLNF